MINSKSIESLNPKTRILATVLLSKAKDEGIIFNITSTLRDAEYQNLLFKSYPKVTNAKGNESYHNYGDAFDVAIIKNKKISNDKNDYYKLSLIAKNIGLSWGGDFKSINDFGHFERRNEETNKKIIAAIKQNSKNLKDSNLILPVIIIGIFILVKFYKGT